MCVYIYIYIYYITTALSCVDCLYCANTFQVFGTADELDAGEQRDAAGEQHREAAQVHVALAARIRRRGIPSVITRLIIIIIVYHVHFSLIIQA